MASSDEVFLAESTDTSSFSHCSFSYARKQHLKAPGVVGTQEPEVSSFSWLPGGSLGKEYVWNAGDVVSISS